MFRVASSLAAAVTGAGELGRSVQCFCKEIRLWIGIVNHFLYPFTSLYTLLFLILEAYVNKLTTGIGDHDRNSYLRCEEGLGNLYSTADSWF